MRGGSTALAFVLALSSWAPSAHANDFDRFQRARSAYEALDYELASDLFLELVGGEVPSLTNRSLVLESRKYLAASLLFLGRMDEAEHQIERLLRDEPDYILDPMAFPDELQRLFAHVQARLTREREAADAESARVTKEAEERSRQKAERDRERLARLVELAKTERVERTSSRWVAMVPFGAGQFQNGDNGLGVSLAITEGLLFSAAVTSFIFHESLRDERPKAEDRDDALFAEKAFRYGNQISMGLFAVVAIAGIIDAQIRFEETEHYERRRDLPDDLKGLTISVRPSGLTATW